MTYLQNRIGFQSGAFSGFREENRIAVTILCNLSITFLQFMCEYTI